MYTKIVVVILFQFFLLFTDPLAAQTGPGMMRSPTIQKDSQNSIVIHQEIAFPVGSARLYSVC
jgi:hypothetical protein